MICKSGPSQPAPAPCLFPDVTGMQEVDEHWGVTVSQVTGYSGQGGSGSVYF